ncbi:FeoA family protein [Polaromonas sp. YR568]|uniref:FeoA family protein n=1 Tax=Polaromonas sp. YR568 TaxID=1855301 RepID=UPI0031382820
MTLAASLHSDPALEPGTLCLVDLPVHRVTTITGLASQGGEAFAGVLQRLSELGFMAGETISVLQRGPGGREPLAVQVGDTVFALRRHEASCIRVKATA